MSDSSNNTLGLRILAFAAVGAWLVYNMATATEMPSPTLASLQYFLLAGLVLGIGHAVYQLMAKN